MMNYYRWPNMMGNTSFFGFGWILVTFFWIFVILAVFYFLKAHRSKDENQSSNKPLDILKERYVKGEIDKKQFEEMKKDIS